MEISPRNALHTDTGAGVLVSRAEIAAGFEKAKQMMAEAGIDSDVTSEDLVDWFEAELPVPELTIGDIVVDPLLLIHELTEIEEITKLGLELTREAIGRNPEKVAAARLKALASELAVAYHFKAAGHLRRRMKDLEARITDASLTADIRGQYKRLHATAGGMLMELANAGRQTIR